MTAVIGVAPGDDLHEAQERARTARGHGHVVVVELADGVHRLATTLAFDTRDSGTTWRAAHAGAAVVSGGVPVTAWRVEGDGSWVADVGAVEARQLWVDDRRSPRPRRSGVGYTMVDDGALAPDDEPSTWPDPADVELVFRAWWTEHRGPVAGVDGRLVRLAQPWLTNARYHRMLYPGEPVRIENVATDLSEPGSHHLDRSSGRLRYLPLPGEDPGRVDAALPRLTTLVTVDGADGLRFEGIGFAHASWPLRVGGDRGLADVQATYFVAGEGVAPHDEQPPDDSGVLHLEAVPAAVEVRRSDGVAIVGCSFVHLGGTGLWLGPGCRGCRVDGCEVADVSGNGIVVGVTDDWRPTPGDEVTRNRVVRCHVHHAGVELAGACGIVGGYVSETLIAGNRLHDLPYTGISVGWGWEFHASSGGTVMHSNRIERNRIERHMQQLADGGGIYTLGEQPGSTIRGNVILDQGPDASGGIYLDEGTRGFTVEGNVIVHTSGRPIYCHKDRGNLIRGNWIEAAADPGASGHSPQAGIHQWHSTGNVVEPGPTIADLSDAPADVVAAAGTWDEV